MPSSSTSSSGSTSPRPCISSRNASWVANASSTGWPMTRSVSTEAAAWLIEQPSASYDTSDDRAVDPAVEVDAQGDLVAARRVHVVHLGLEGLPQPAVVRVAVVVEDDLLVQASRSTVALTYLEVLLGVVRPLDQRVDLARRRVEVRRGTGGALHAEARVRRLGAVVAGADGDPPAVEQLRDVVRVHPVDLEGHRSPRSAASRGPSTVIPGRSARPARRWAVIACSWRWMWSRPISLM